MAGSAVLALEDGSVFHGVAIGAEGSSSGEVVFNTSMTGYQEIPILTSVAQARTKKTTSPVRFGPPVWLFVTCHC